MMNETTGKSISYTYNPMDYVQQGWQCPICKRVLAPFMTECPYHQDTKWTHTSATGILEE